MNIQDLVDFALTTKFKLRSSLHHHSWHNCNSSTIMWLTIEFCKLLVVFLRLLQLVVQNLSIHDIVAFFHPTNNVHFKNSLYFFYVWAYTQTLSANDNHYNLYLDRHLWVILCIYSQNTLPRICMVMIIFIYMHICKCKHYTHENDVASAIFDDRRIPPSSSTFGNTVFYATVLTW